MQSATVGYWIDQDWAGQGLVAEGVVVLAEFAFTQLDLHRLEICIVPRNSNSRRVMEKLELPGGGRRRALPRDQRRLGGPRPLRVHRRGVDRARGRAARALALSDAGRYASPASRVASALAWRILLRRFHIFSFQWRLRPRLASLSLATSASWW